jgi:acetolactate synthase-1/2/3 large subunit
MELQTASAHNIGVKVLLLNNGVQGMVRQWQDLFYDQRYMATSMKNPDFSALARSMHCKAITLRNRSEMKEKLLEFIEARGPVVLDCWTDAREHVYPMVPSGKGLHEMTIGPNRSLDIKA